MIFEIKMFCAQHLYDANIRHIKSKCNIFNINLIHFFFFLYLLI